MHFLGVSPLRYIKSEEISPVKRMTANEWSSQPAHSARSSQPFPFLIAALYSSRLQEADTHTISVRTLNPTQRNMPAAQHRNFYAQYLHMLLPRPAGCTRTHFPKESGQI
jgi:hypothetical protein